jgi:transposase-like protein
MVHKIGNVLNKVATSVQPAMKKDLQEIWRAPDRKVAQDALDLFATKYGAKYAGAVECLTKDRDALLAFYDFPAEHWGSGLKPSKFPEPWEINSLSERDVCEEDIKVDRLAAVAEHVAPEEVDVPPGHGGDFLQ